MVDCVVVGANGFLGSHLVDALAARGHNVTAFDRFTEDQQFVAEGVKRVEGDFMNRSDLMRALDGQEQVFHFLSTSSPATSENDPTLDVETNVVGSIALFQVAVEAGVRRIAFASTGGAIYGDQNALRITEESIPMPISPYAIGKLTIEGYLRYFERKHGLQSVSFRISNPYGPRQHPHKKQGVIPIFLQQIAEGMPITVLGDGTMMRDYIYVGDVARMIVETVNRTPAFPVYNVGSGHGTSVNELVGLAREITGRRVVVNHADQPVTFVQRSILDVERFSSEFAGTALVDLPEGMALTWQDTVEGAR